ncbi:MAG: FecR domain-containing protein [Candidatus Acidiferrales bacterium]
MMDARNTHAEKAKISRVEVYWHTVRYRTVVLYVALVTVIVLAAVCMAFPGFTGNLVRRISDAVTPNGGGVANITAMQARFVNLDGRVQVKKSNSVQWENADYQITLDKGDLIQTDSGGMARIAFADGTTYTVKGDTLVTVEENIVAQDRATQVGVHISAGQVDLATGSWPVPGSKAEVSFENAVASLHANSRAAVSTDPATQEQQITVAAGSAELNRGNEHVDIGQYQRVEFPTGGPMTKSDVLAPPQLVEPLNLQPIILADPKHDPIHFSWNPVPTAKLYTFQASETTVFNSIVIERKTTDPSVDVAGFDPGDYFWRVRAVDAKGNVSDASDPFKFTLVAQGKEQDMILEVDSYELQGNVVEVIGHTEPGAALIVNGEQVADIQSDGKFRYFTEPMQRGSHEIVITGQNRRGGTAIKRVEVVIP